MGSGIRVSGMVSGLDTESIVSALVSTQVEKKNKYIKAKTKLEWKEEAYKAINTKVYSLYNKASNLRFSSAYNLRKTTVSDPTKATVTASSSAINGMQTLQIKELAKSGYITGAKLDSGTSGSSTLASLGYTGGSSTISVRVGDSSKDIEIDSSTTIDQFVESLNKAGVKASYDSNNQRIFVSAKDTGVDNDFSLTASSSDGLAAIKALGLQTAKMSDADKAAYTKMKSYAVYGEDGTTFDASATQASIESLLTTLKDAYASNAALETEKSELNADLKYSKSWDAIQEFRDANADDPEKAQKAEDLLRLLKYGESNYAYIKENGDGTFEITNDNEGYASWATVTEKAKSLAKELGLITSKEVDGETTEDTSALDTLYENVKNVKSYDGDGEELGTSPNAEHYLLKENGEYVTTVDGETVTVADRITAIDNTITANNQLISDNSYWDLGKTAYLDEGFDVSTEAAKITEKIQMAIDALANAEDNSGDTSGKYATRINASDATIILNGAEFTSSSNTFDINGLSIKATGVTADDEEITLSTDVDSQGIYDEIKSFLKEYNEVINEISTLYNADSASGYEPLTDEEKAEMSDSEVEKWEEKVKNALLRKDSTLGSIITAMSSSMIQAYEVNGTTYSLGSFGIETLGFLNASKNEQYAFHIAGDSEDDVSKGKDDKLLYAIQNNPDDVVEFMKQLTTGLYKELDNKMKGTTLKSTYSIYNDKQMTKDIASYKTLISTWEDKISDLEDRYYSQFSTMEKMLAQMQSSTSALSSLMGTS
ncbi:MAG: flagellar filament capping protein FliD [Lachnospiraceae bacterium]|nr:flagellar filament capping protein FliD [Lachnospiraceae bacterium]